MSQPRLPMRPRSRPYRLHVERLEDRALLSAGRGSAGLTDFASLVAVPGSYDPSTILVRFRPGAIPQEGTDILAGTSIGRSLGAVAGLHAVQLGTGVSVAAALAAYRHSGLVEYAEPNYTLRPAATFPNDPQFGQLWGLYNTGQTGGQPRAHINAPPVWDASVGSLSQVVAVLDTGIDYNHPDLYQNIWINQSEIPASRLANLTDSDGDGLITFWDLNRPENQGPFRITDVNSDGRISAADILAPMRLDKLGQDLGRGGWANRVAEDGDAQHLDDLVGWNFASNTNTPLDTVGHGTHVAGIIGAVGDNALGVVGVNWRVRLMPLKIGNSLELNLAAAVEALGYAVANGAMVSNHSYVSSSAPQALFDAMAAAGAAGHIVVAAAGNEGSDNDVTPVYPAGFNLANLIAVAATDHNDNRANFSNYGLTTVHLGAPGAQILSTSLNGGYETRSGTSMAAAYVTGAAAYLRSVYPILTHDQLIGLILSSSEPIPALAGLTITGGRLSLYRALAGTIIPEEGGFTGPGDDGWFVEQPVQDTEDAVAISILLDPTPVTGFELTPAPQLPPAGEESGAPADALPDSEFAPTPMAPVPYLGVEMSGGDEQPWYLALVWHELQ